MFRHPSTGPNHSNDIAVVLLEKPVNYTEYIRPICLPESDFKPSITAVCYTSGWTTRASGTSEFGIVSSFKNYELFGNEISEKI